ncbi:DUF1217 domain-containing protein [Shimia sediminis]|uniref:DUF1217 domain-containing protein n=1 Tax=Shimia sediminis TaxID=2497945 RepID=UPI000F8F2A23|nr:DUF1217 domain-containing protein [Shimia sediminis]
MSFQPVLPTGGLVGWAFLQRTLEDQTTAFNQAATMQRDTAYFEENIGKIDTAEELVSDRRLLRVALGAFGLSDDIDNTFFIRKILEDGTLSDDALSNRLTDTRYKDLASAFGFGDFATPSTKISNFGSDITESYRQRQFEVAVGAQDESMRLAMNADRELAEFGSSSESEDTKWFRVLGSPPLRQVFETALGMPSSFSQLDIDRQLNLLKERSESQFGDSSVAQFETTSMRETLVERYLLMSQIKDSPSSSPAEIALTLLQS